MSALTPQILVESNISDESDWFDVEYDVEYMKELFSEAGLTDYSITHSCDLPENIDFDDLSEVCEIARLATKHGTAYIKFVDEFNETSESSFLASTRGKYDSMEDFVKSWVTDTEEIPERILPYINWNKYVREYESSHVFVDGYVFSNSW